MPFEEDEKDPSIWFLDHSYLENMFRMFKKVNGKLVIVPLSGSTSTVFSLHLPWGSVYFLAYRALGHISRHEESL